MNNISRGECDLDIETGGTGEADRPISTTLCPILLTALVEIELISECASSGELLVVLKFVLPTTNVTLSVIDFSVATASS